MPSRQPLAQVSDVVSLWRPLLNDVERQTVVDLIRRASAKLRKETRGIWAVELDDRMKLPDTDRLYLDPEVTADRVAVIVARFLRNPDGVASNSRSVGPFSRSQTYVNRYDKTGADVRGEIRVTPEDIAELAPTEEPTTPGTFRVGIPNPESLIPRVTSPLPTDPTGGGVPVTVPAYPPSPAYDYPWPR